MKYTQQAYLNEYVDFEYRQMTYDIFRFNEFTLTKWFRQIGFRLSKAKGLDSATQQQMVQLTEKFTLENFFEFGKLLVGINPKGLLTMQTVLSLESEYLTNK